MTPSLSPSASPSLSPLIDTAVLCADTDAILADWEETLIIHRLAITYGADGQAAETWSAIGTFAGDWQAPSGSLLYNEAGEVVPNSGKVIGPCGLTVEEGDRLVQSDGSYMEVVYVAVHEGHTSIFINEPKRGSISVALKPTEALYKSDITDDTDTILEDWYERVTINRRSTSYDDSGKDSSSFAALTTLMGDWQPLSGDLPAEEYGKAARSVAQILTRPDVSVLEDDQVVRRDGTVYYVNYIKWHEDHCTIRLKRTEGQQA